MNKFSSEAEELRVEKARLAAIEARREKMKEALMSGVVLALYVIVIVKHADIRDTVATLFRSKEPEYQSILAVAEEIDAEKAGKSVEPADPSSHKAKLKESLNEAKENAALVEDVMNHPLEGKAP